jgi:hypothetical protein
MPRKRYRDKYDILGMSPFRVLVTDLHGRERVKAASTFRKAARIATMGMEEDGIAASVECRTRTDWESVYECNQDECWEINTRRARACLKRRD